MGELYRLDFASGKSYIGITEKTAVKRFKGHAASARHAAGTLIHNAWRKYGEPTLVVLAVVEDFDLLETEKRAIKIFKTLTPFGYNTTEGGDFNHSKLESVNRKRADKMRGREIHPNSLAALIAANKGRKFTEQHLANLSKGAKGKPKSEEHKRNIGLANLGRKNSPSSIEAMRKALTGRKNPEHSKRMLGNQNWKFRKSEKEKQA